MLLPILLTVFSSAAYHFTLKHISTKANMFAGLFWTYLISAVICLFFYFGQKNNDLFTVFSSEKSYLYILLALSLVGIELGYLFAYKGGGQVGQVSMIAQAISMILLVGIGYYTSKDSITLTKMLGVISGIISFTLLAR